MTVLVMYSEGNFVMTEDSFCNKIIALLAGEATLLNIIIYIPSLF